MFLLIGSLFLIFPFSEFSSRGEGGFPLVASLPSFLVVMETSLEVQIADSE